MSLPFSSHLQASTRDYENRSPFRLRYASLASYLLFSLLLSSAPTGSCLVGAGSMLASILGFPLVPPYPGPPAIPLPAPLRLELCGAAESNWDVVDCEDDWGLFKCCCSSWNTAMRFWRSVSAFAARSALMERLAKKYAPPPATMSVAQP
jgi:hypothetical protein